MPSAPRWRSIIDPHTGLDLVAAHAVRGVGVDGGNVAIELQLGYPAAGWHEALAAQVDAAWSARVPGVAGGHRRHRHPRASRTACRRT